jgi:hypothetical protein
MASLTKVRPAIPTGQNHVEKNHIRCRASMIQLYSLPGIGRFDRLKAVRLQHSGQANTCNGTAAYFISSSILRSLIASRN